MHITNVQRWPTMTTRIHIVLDEVDKARYRSQADREGKSLAAWLREAAEEKIAGVLDRRRFSARADVEGFFEECDTREPRPEPDWEEHRRVAERSRSQGSEVT